MIPEAIDHGIKQFTRIAAHALSLAGQDSAIAGRGAIAGLKISDAAVGASVLAPIVGVRT